MVKAPCAHDWDTINKTDKGEARYCHKCETYRYDPHIKMPPLPEGDLYYLEET